VGAAELVRPKVSKVWVPTDSESFRSRRLAIISGINIGRL